MRRNILLLALLSILTLSHCSKNEEVVIPQVSIFGTSKSRSTSSNVGMTFNISLNKAVSQDVSVNYSTSPGTALADKDYITKSGTLVIPAGTQTASLEITITSGNERKDDQTFYLIFDSPKNCTLENTKAVGKILNDSGVIFNIDNKGYTTPTEYPGYTLKWSDEFSGTAVNTSDWTFEKGNNNGWGNNELENYTDRSQNVFVSNGNLVIEARQETLSGFNYTSTRMITKGKRSFTYGRIDIRAKVPKGKGIWPALWMLGSNIDQKSWPACGEIDIMELIGQEPNKVHGTVHYGASAPSRNKTGSYILSSGSFDQEFHVYSLIWDKDNLKILVDDINYFSAKSSDISSPYPFDLPFFFIFNIAVGGNWPGSPDNTTIFPQRMVVDYVRVFQ
jgi:hypothetical protein